MLCCCAHMERRPPAALNAPVQARAGFACGGDARASSLGSASERMRAALAQSPLHAVMPDFRVSACACGAGWRVVRRGAHASAGAAGGCSGGRSHRRTWGQPAVTTATAPPPLPRLQRRQRAVAERDAAQKRRSTAADFRQRTASSPAPLLGLLIIAVALIG